MVESFRGRVCFIGRAKGHSMDSADFLKLPPKRLNVGSSSSGIAWSAPLHSFLSCHSWIGNRLASHAKCLVTSAGSASSSVAVLFPALTAHPVELSAPPSPLLPPSGRPVTRFPSAAMLRSSIDWRGSSRSWQLSMRKCPCRHPARRPTW